MNIEKNNWLERVAQVIRIERQNRKLTQKKFATALNISQSMLSKIENQEMPPTLICWLRFCDQFSIFPGVVLQRETFEGWLKEKQL